MRDRRHSNSRVRWNWRKHVYDGRTDEDQDHVGRITDYYFDVWVGDQVGQEVILGIDFMVPAGIRLDLADGTLCLPDEVRINLAGRKPPYRSTIQAINLTDQHVVIPVGGSTEVRIGVGPPKAKLWVRRGMDVGADGHLWTRPNKVFAAHEPQRS